MKDQRRVVRPLPRPIHTGIPDRVQRLLPQAGGVLRAALGRGQLGLRPDQLNPLGAVVEVRQRCDLQILARRRQISGLQILLCQTDKINCDPFARVDPALRIGQVQHLKRSLLQGSIQGFPARLVERQ